MCNCMTPLLHTYFLRVFRAISRYFSGYLMDRITVSLISWNDQHHVSLTCLI